MTREQLKEKIYQEWLKCFEKIKTSESDILYYFVSDKSHQEIERLEDAMNEYANENISVYNEDHIQFVKDHLDICEEAMAFIGGLEWVADGCESIKDLLHRIGLESIYYYNTKILTENKELIVNYLMLANLYDIANESKGNIYKLQRFLNDIICGRLEYFDVDYIPQTYNQFLEVLE